MWVTAVVDNVGGDGYLKFMGRVTLFDVNGLTANVRRK